MDSKLELHKFTCVILIILGLFACRTSSFRTLRDVYMTEKHEQWMARHGRLYENEAEKERRFEIFKNNVERIESFNNAAVNRPYKLSVNEFADQTNEEFRAARNGYKSVSTLGTSTSFKYENLTAVPSSMDWRSKGAVTPVKDQGQCGCCWAFSAVAAMEGITKLTTGKLISLSEQELVDCDVHGIDQGCGGGLMDDAFKFIEKNKGLTTEANYPYKGVDGTCNTKKTASSAAKITSYEDVPANSETALLKAVASQPVSVAIDAGGFDFQFYSSGVFTGECGTQLDHGVTAVGYGTSEDGTKYWLVKNSWGTGWGENGYIRMQRDVVYINLIDYIMDSKLELHKFTCVILIILGLFACRTSSFRTLRDVYMTEKHEQWMAHHGRVYENEAEKERRFEIFMNNVKGIESFNNAVVNRSYSLSLNEFADQTNEEFRAARYGYKSSRVPASLGTTTSSFFKYENLTDVPPSMDWRVEGVVTPVKNQGQCGCCWAFSAVAAMEGITKLKTGNLISLSEQELVDCDVKGFNRGCSGGWMDKAFKFIVMNKGLTTEANYPYMGVDGSYCDPQKTATSEAEITGYEDVPANSETALLKAVASQPVSVAIDAGGFDFQFYSGGVFNGEQCGTKLNHAVTAIGYGTSEDGTKYWIVKNSWGTGWGENGYMRIQRDVDAMEGLCGIAMKASYPTV
ncbi:Peptidase C1A [Macleaya cordata]|uniref:Peptidase C1A n=1 Tax=Macleaya cordata TaxID=56857 RepID=A0A200QWF5_MACCD|nr:Peptidase C1A [Macleaya cordata]